MSSVLHRAGNLSDVDYLLIHGTGDGEQSRQTFLSLAETTFIRLGGGGGGGEN